MKVMDFIKSVEDDFEKYKYIANSYNGEVDEKTELAEELFKIEEGKEDLEIKMQQTNKVRRDWLVMADIFNQGFYNQRFHLYIYLQFNLKNKKIKGTDIIKVGRIRNHALKLYIREVINGEDHELVKTDYLQIVEHYKNNKINTAVKL
ncbi:hypothetical protein A4S06_11225 [Erysipelotrichaceae bacterium MTC7]|nr:hypothetical protein A4S06_11225 [Erysipelotrichaceae bacterium MTC7]